MFFKHSQIIYIILHLYFLSMVYSCFFLLYVCRLLGIYRMLQVDVLWGIADESKDSSLRNNGGTIVSHSIGYDI
jgi:hypothetical protein